MKLKFVHFLQHMDLILEGSRILGFKHSSEKVGRMVKRYKGIKKPLKPWPLESLDPILQQSLRSTGVVMIQTKLRPPIIIEKFRIFKKEQQQG